MIEIEKGVPIPSGVGREKYPWRDMQVGDSFLIPGASSKVASSLCCNPRRLGLGKYTVRAVKGGVRVWRIA